MAIVTSDQIKKLLADGEGLTVEFKECVNELNNSVFETVSSLKIYSGHEPELIEGDVFKTIVPLKGIGAIGFTGDVPNEEVAGMLPDKVAGKLTPAEEAFLKSLMPFFKEREWLTNAEMREATGKSESSVKRFMRNLTEKGVLDARGGTRNRQYRLCLR